jgi:hypothetical protein
MEFWEGAVLIIGGLYLVSRVTRKTVVVAPVNANLATNVSGLTQLTNTAGTSSLVAGEDLAAPTPSIPSTSIATRSPVTVAPVKAPLSNRIARPVSPVRKGMIA